MALFITIFFESHRMFQQFYMGFFKRVGLLSLLMITLVYTGVTSADQFIVKDGKALAQIVVSDTPQRTSLVAARELQSYIEKITGAKLAIVTTKDNDKPVNIYVGQSEYTDKLGLKLDGLDKGAYRIVAGENWLALIGQDTNFVPFEPWARNRAQRGSDKGEAAWDKVTGNHWGWALGSMFKYYMGRSFNFDPAKKLDINDGKPVEFWQFDERGSYNAVCAFLRGQGVRWYMPGEIGEVLPEFDSIMLPVVDYVERPDVAVRQFNNRFAIATPETTRWFMHLGARQDYGMQIAHGLALMTSRDEYKQAHPDYYALYGNTRATDRNQLCLSSPGLFKDTVAYVNALMDNIGIDEVSIMPNDAYIAICQCPLCEGKSTPERGYRGLLSDHVWTFVNNVAKEVGKTHPNKKVLCLAYGSYREVPLTIDKLEPNVRVGIVNGRGPREADLADAGKLSDIYVAWIKKTDNKILNFENYPFTGRGWYLPTYTPVIIVNGLNATKQYSIGEDIWLSIGRELDEPAYNHLNVYFTARSWWGGQNDAQAMFDEYCTLFYGPAAAPMKAFFEYCEANGKDMSKDAVKIDKVLALFDAGKKAVDAKSIYGQRIALIDKYLQTLRNRKGQLTKELDRTGVPTVHLAQGVSDMKIDGVLDEHVWTQSAGWGKGSLHDLETGGATPYATSFRVAWEGSNLYFGIRCTDPDMAGINIATKNHDDQSIWYGDTVELLIETDKESYYQIAINPAGAIADVYRAGAKSKADFNWDSQAEIATKQDADGWTIEIRLPVVEESEDPLHQIIGSKPQPTLPWYINVCRARIRDNKTVLSAFSPTGEKSFHVLHKLGKLDSKVSSRGKAAKPQETKDAE